MFFSAPQMQPLGCVSHQRNGSSGSCPLCPGHANPVHRPDLAAGTSSRTRTQTPTEPHPRHSAAGLLPCTRQHKPGHTLCKDDTELGRGCCFNDRKDSCRVGFKTLVTSVCSYVVVLCTNQQRSAQF